MSSKTITVLSLSLIAGGPLWAADAPKPSDSARTCVDVQIGDDRTAYLNCLNEEFQRRVRQEHEVPQIDAPISGRSSPNQVEGFNETAAREQMGNAFGVSAVPQRPPKPVFVNPLLPNKPQ